MLIFALCSFW